ncbi:conserved hypothetical protein [Paraburkholderia tropica]|uniref:hypothetical protein n=1 Tax=Paraburkholderia tropica TaxID=92647 RepID=UPI001CB10ED9|nr:hypothetical protein [Paraburkholderia tropica]CAG9239339.1 conserved hypothetical protein [Paraburkholderia tropica]
MTKKPTFLNDLLERAMREPNADVTYDGNGDVRRYIPRRPIVNSLIDLNGDMLPELQTKSGMHLKRPPVGRPAGQTITLGADIIAQSLVAQAGANVIIYQDTTSAIPVGPADDVFMQNIPTYFETVEASPFALVPDGQEVAVSTLPISRAQIHVDTSGGPQTNTGIYMLRFEFDRATMKGYPDFSDAIMHAITAGLARTADAVLLGAIVAKNPAAFTLSAAAAASVRFDELRAVIGTAGTGAAVGQDGVLRAAGVRGELTADMATTIVGAFSRSAIMIRSTVDVFAERVSAANPLTGTLAVTAIVSLQPLLPDTSRFWTVGA